MIKGRVLVRWHDREQWYELPVPPDVRDDLINERAVVIRYDQAERLP